MITFIESLQPEHVTTSTPWHAIFGRRAKIMSISATFSDTQLIDHLIMRDFVSGLSSFRSIYERDSDRNPSLREGS